MENVRDYVEKVIIELDNLDAFDGEDVFMDKSFLREELTLAASANNKSTGNPILNEDQFYAAIDNAKSKVLKATMDDLLEQGKIKITGVDENGEFLYGLAN